MTSELNVFQETKTCGPFTFWAPRAVSRFNTWWFAPYYNRRRRGGFFIGWGCLFWFFLAVIFTAMALYFVIIPMHIIAAIAAAQIVSLVGEGAYWLAWGCWHKDLARMSHV